MHTVSRRGLFGSLAAAVAGVLAAKLPQATHAAPAGGFTPRTAVTTISASPVLNFEALPVDGVPVEHIPGGMEYFSLPMEGWPRIRTVDVGVDPVDYPEAVAWVSDTVFPDITPAFQYGAGVEQWRPVVQAHCNFAGCEEKVMRMIACESAGTGDNSIVGPNGELGILQIHPNGSYSYLYGSSGEAQIAALVSAINQGVAGIESGGWVCS